MKIIKKAIRHLIFRNKFSKNFFKLLPKNWTDERGENLFHYASYYHSDFLFIKALENKANINQRNKKNFLPIHTLIECSFVTGDIIYKPYRVWIKDYFILIIEWLKEKFENQDISYADYIKNETEERLAYSKSKEHIRLEPNMSLVQNFIDNGADINAFCREESFTYDIKSHLGSPIGLLIELFIRAILTPNFNNPDILDKYDKLYELLSKSGANINVLKSSGYFGEKDIIVDAMQITNSINLSNFFIRNIKDNKYAYAILPLLRDPKINYHIQDESGSTILHSLIGKLVNRNHLFEEEILNEILTAVVNNPSFDSTYLEIKNNHNQSPLTLIKSAKIEDREIFNNYLLKIKLEDKMPNKTTKIKKNKKI